MDLDLTLNDYWTIIRKRKYTVIFLFLITSVTSIVVTRFQTPLYRAQAMVKFDPSIAKVGGEIPAYLLLPTMETFITLIASPDMNARVAKKMGGSLPGTYQAERIQTSSLIRILATGPDPAKVAKMANLIAETLLEWDLESRSQQLRQTLEDAQQRKNEVEKSLHVLEEQRKKFLEEHETTGLGSALASNLLDLEGRRKELLRKFTESHPEMRKLDQRIELVRKRLAQLPAEEEDLMRINRDLKVQEEAFIALSRQVEETQIKVQSTVSYVSVVSRASEPSFPFSPNKPRNYAGGVVLGLFFGIFAALMLESLDISITTIEDIEKVLEAPVLGIIPHFGSESKWWDLMINIFRKDRHPEEVFRSFLVFRHAPKSPHIEVYHSLRVNIQSQLNKPENMVLTFTSTGVAEGKTLTAANFAMAAAHSGLKTLLIGADIRRPILHSIFGLPKEPGLIEALTGRLPWQETIRNTLDVLMGEQDLDKLTSFPGIDNFKLMTGWSHSTAEVVNLFSSHRLPKLIADLRANFDIVIFDCPPVLLFVDAMLIGQHTDGVVLVYKSGKMARRALKRARDQVQSSKGKILGVVLNDARATDMGPGYGYYSDYGHYIKPQPESS